MVHTNFSRMSTLFLVRRNTNVGFKLIGSNLRDCMIVYIEREIAIMFTTDSIIHDLYAKKSRKVRLK